MSWLLFSSLREECPEAPSGAGGEEGLSLYSDSTRREGQVLKEFRAFITRGNLIEIAVGLVMALAFVAVINALVGNIVMPLVAAIVGEPSFDSLTVTIHKSVISYGSFITALVNLVLVAAALFFFVVKPMSMWQDRRARGKEQAPPETAEEILLLREIRDKLSLTR